MKLEKVYRKIVSLLNKERFNYLVIGGIAAGVMGEPRVTGDIDFCIFIKKEEAKNFLKKVKKGGFKFEQEEVTKRVKETGTFKIWYEDFHVDFIIASTEFEEKALERKQKIIFQNIPAFFPSVEDLIISKIIPGRPQDIIDAEKIVMRNFNRLDVKYLQSWAQKLSDEAENLRIWNELERMLKGDKKR